MLQKIRDRAQGWFAYTIVALLTVPFAVWGINYYFEGGGSMDAARVGDSKISLQEYQRAYQQQRQRLQSMMGDQFDAALLEGAGLKQDVLRQMVNERVLTQLVSQQGMRVSDTQLRQALLSLPVFQQSGGFSKEMYERLLRSQGYTVSGFEEGLRQSLATEQLQNGVSASALLTTAELDKLVALLKQQREIYFLTLALAQYVERAQLDEAALQDYFTKNQQSFVNPERLRLQFVELKLADIAAPITISAAQIQSTYEAQQDKYGRPEERSASHVLVQVPAGATPEQVTAAQTRAQEIADALHSGSKTFEQALEEAKADGAMEGGDLGAISRGMFGDAALENALFALEKVGDMSQPVRMPSGFHIVRLDRVTPAALKPLDEVREEIAKELRQQQAENQFYEITQTLANLGYEHPDTLETAAQKLDVPLQESDWFTRQGGKGITKQPKVLESAFSEDVLKRGLNSEPLELEPGHVVMLRVNEHEEATPRTFAEARDEVEKLLRQRQGQEALDKDLATIKQRAAQGEHLQSLAKEFHATFKQLGLVGRDAKDVDSALLAAAFRVPQPAAEQISLGSSTLAAGDQAVFAVVRVVAGATDAVAEAERQQLSKQFAQQIGAADFAQLLESVQAKTKIILYSDRL